MRLASLALVMSLTVPFATGCMKASTGDPDPVGNGSEPIVNGTAATAYPEAVLVDLYSGGQLQGYCSGSVIAPDVVMTAGHCVYQFTQWQIHAPYVNQSASASAGVTYDWTATGESVDPTMHDIGLIFLNSDITLSTYPTIASSPVAFGSQVVNIGRIRNGQLSMSGLYVSGNVTVHDGGQVGYPFDYEANDVIESGDSGGPDEAVGTHTIVAVNSGGGSDEVLARTDLIYSWIQSEIQNHGGTGATSSGVGVSTGTGAQSCSDCQTSAESGACASATSACGNSQDCLDLNNCLGGCSDQTCVDNCAAAYPNGVDLYNAFVGCICNTACVSECATECGSSSSSSTTGAGAGSGVGTGVGVGSGVGVGVGASTGSSTATLGAGVGGASPVGAGGAGGGGGHDLKDQQAGDNGGCSFGTGSSSAAWTVALLGLALAAARRRRS